MKCNGPSVISSIGVAFGNQHRLHQAQLHMPNEKELCGIRWPMMPIVHLKILIKITNHPCNFNLSSAPSPLKCLLPPSAYSTPSIFNITPIKDGTDMFKKSSTTAIP